MARVEIRPVTRDNRRDVVAVSTRPDQERFVAPISYYPALCRYGGEWQPPALYSNGAAIGFAMWAFDPDDWSRWIGGLVIDRVHQGRRLGRGAVEAILGFVREHGARDIALSYEPENMVAQRLYESLGFRETGEMEGDEIVARLSLG